MNRTRQTQPTKPIGPPYTFKVVKGHGKDERMEVIPPCISYTIVKQWDDEADEQTGWEFQLTRRPPMKGKKMNNIRLPQHGRAVYIENVNGKTVMSFRWPEKQGERVLRVMDTAGQGG